MAKGFKLRVSLHSFQFCRSRKSSNLPKSPLPASYFFTPLNPKSSDIAIPNPPIPPPTTPTHPSNKTKNTSHPHHHPQQDMIIPVGYWCAPTSSEYEFSDSSPAVYISGENKNNPLQKMYNSPIYDAGSEENSINWSSSSSMAILPNNIKNKTEAIISSNYASVSSAESSRWFSSEFGGLDDETESFFSSSKSFDSSFELDNSINEDLLINRSSGRNTKNRAKPRRLKRYVSNNQRTSTIKGSENEIGSLKKSVLEKLMPCMVDGNDVVNESFAIIKKSEDPYEDFKGSMMEMIVEKEIYEAKDLERLLQCLLSLNSRQHHAVIVKAFTDIWETLFCRSDKIQRS